MHFGADGALDFKSGASSFVSAGLLSLAQKAMVDLISDPAPSGTGAGLAKLLLRSDVRDVTVADISDVVSAAETHILQNQSGLTSDETLSSMKLTSAVQTDGRWDLRIELKNAAGDTQVIDPGI